MPILAPVLDSEMSLNTGCELGKAEPTCSVSIFPLTWIVAEVGWPAAGTGFSADPVTPVDGACGLDVGALDPVVPVDPVELPGAATAICGTNGFLPENWLKE